MDGSGITTTFNLPHTSFIAVSAYQSPTLTQLKITKNPCSNAFRKQGGRKKNGKAAGSKGGSPAPPAHTGGTKCLTEGGGVEMEGLSDINLDGLGNLDDLVSISTYSVEVACTYHAGVSIECVK